MNGLFTSILNMSIAGSIVIIVILLGRLLIKNAPKKWSYLLWIAAAFRLCCPVSIRSAFSLFRVLPQPEAAKTAASTAGETVGRLNYIPAAVNAPAPTSIPAAPSALPIKPLPLTQATSIPSVATANPVITSAPVTLNPVAGAVTNEVTNTAAPANPLQIAMTVLTVLWLAGIAALIIYAIVDYIRLRKNVSTATKLAGENKAFESENIRSPFILGFIRPRIYIPYGLSERERQYVLAHERTHLRRGDHIIKAFSFVLLALHWFNPLCWLAFFLMNRDMEMSCDETVLAKNNIRKEYSTTLLSFAAGKRFSLPAPGPITFGETAVKERIKNAMKYKKPKLIVTIIAVTLCVAIVAACATNPLGEKQDANNETPDTETTPAPGNETTPEPTVEPTVEPTAAPTLEPTAETTAYWPVDIDGDGVDERLAMDLEALFNESNQAPYVVLSDGTEITGFEPISPAHAGVGTYGITVRDGRGYILEHRIQNYSGGHISDRYTLWTVENGSLVPAEQNEIEYNLAYSMDRNTNDVDAVIAYYDALNAVWRDSELAICADPFIAFGLFYYDGDTHRPVMTDDRYYDYVIAYNRDAVHAAAEGTGYADEHQLIVAEGKAQYVFDLVEALDAELMNEDGYDTGWDLAEKLRFNNHVIERYWDYVEIMNYLGYENTETIELLSETLGANGVWTYIFRDNATGKSYSIIGGDPATIKEV